MLGRSVSRDIAEVERQVGQLRRDLEHRLSHLNTLTRRGAHRASRQASYYAADVADRFRDSANSPLRSLTDDAARLGGRALRRIGDEVEQRPLLTIAIGAGIALLVVGLVARRHRGVGNDAAWRDHSSRLPWHRSRVLRLYALAYGACVVLAIVAMFEVTAAAVLVLEPHLGGAMARLAIAFVIGVSIAGIIVALRIARRPKQKSPATAAAHALPIATLLEVFLLGYSLAQRLSEDRKSQRR